MSTWSGENPAAIVVDLGASAESPQPADVQAWARQQTVFVSSAMGEDMDATRSAVAEAVESFGCKVSVFERFGGRDDDPEQAYIAEVAASTIYVGLLASRYGAPHDGGFSATHLEFLEARDRRLRLCVFADRRASMEGHQQSFLTEVRKFHTTGSYGSPESAATGVLDRLRQIAAEEIAPWVMIDGLVVRARRSQVVGDNLTLDLSVRDDNIRRRLEDLGDGHGFGRGEVRVVEHSRVHQARVSAVRRTSTSNNGHEITFEAAVSPVGRSSIMGASLNTGGQTYGPDELSQLSVSDALFGTSLSPSPGWGPSAGEPSPLDRLRGLALSDAVRRPVVRLILTEWIVAGGHGDWVSAVDIGAAQPSKSRSLRIQWGRRSPYSNGEDSQLEVKGTVPAL